MFLGAIIQFESNNFMNQVVSWYLKVEKKMTYVNTYLYNINKHLSICLEQSSVLSKSLI